MGAELASTTRNDASGSGTRVAYFHAGDVGAGHLVRGIGIGRALERAGFRGTYRMFGPALPFHIAGRSDYEVVSICREDLQDPARAPETPLAEAIQRFEPDLLLVDMFWAPLRYILMNSLPCEAWLLIRRCPPVWFLGPPQAPFEPSQFARIIAIEPTTHPMLRERIDPVVVSDPDECQPSGALRERFAVGSGEKLTVVMHAGVPGECKGLRPSRRSERILTLDLHDAGALFPAAAWLRDADAIFCGAGYNAYWEARWLGYEHRTHFTPLARRIDDQAWRVQACRDFMPRENGADTLARMIGSQ